MAFDRFTKPRRSIMVEKPDKEGSKKSRLTFSPRPILVG
jgi:hypothetical protein